jgi:hypothetical protein
VTEKTITTNQKTIQNEPTNHIEKSNTIKETKTNETGLKEQSNSHSLFSRVKEQGRRRMLIVKRKKLDKMLNRSHHARFQTRKFDMQQNAKEDAIFTHLVCGHHCFDRHQHLFHLVVVLPSLQHGQTVARHFASRSHTRQIDFGAKRNNRRF